MLKNILVALSIAPVAEGQKTKPKATMSKPSPSALTLSSVVDTLIGKTQGHTTTAKTIQHKLAVALAAGKPTLPVAVVLEKHLVTTSAAKIEALERIAYAAANLANITGTNLGSRTVMGSKFQTSRKGKAPPQTAPTPRQTFTWKQWSKHMQQATTQHTTRQQQKKTGKHQKDSTNSRSTMFRS
uniref:Variant surface glycoprotein (VSG) n=1 Tax=Trypanosoma brucei brucei (strain 927/4 GUTat10.1) TaxID=185431 RepID=Q4FKN1_TRYB2|nr:hypothetical protein Tb10.v4.0078 [Trypanosoma brucei brucei TREU927]